MPKPPYLAAFSILLHFRDVGLIRKFGWVTPKKEVVLTPSMMLPSATTAAKAASFKVTWRVVSDEATPVKCRLSVLKQA